ncbi:MAG: cell division protein FtsQ/DivIB [Bacteroidota bacterium]
MKFNWIYIKMLALVAVLAFLYGFANKRNQSKPVTQLAVQFDTTSELYVTENAVNNLLIQNSDSQVDLKKDSLDLDVMERQLKNHEMIKTAEVFLTLDGTLGAKITQRKPILRFYDGGFHYLDEEGKIMPLSPNYSARVPVAFGFSSEEIIEKYPLIAQLTEDDFYRQQFVEITKNKSEQIEIKLRDADFIVNFGNLNNTELKLANLKAFFAKASKHKILNDYQRVDLQFGNQVVCTKK